MKRESLKHNISTDEPDAGSTGQLKNNSVRMKLTCLLPCLFLLLTVYHPSYSQPQPGDIFREYIWVTPEGNNSSYLRVGGKLDYGVKQKIYPDIKFSGRNIPLGHIIDLNKAIKAEVVIEKVLCHFGTRNLRISFNDNEFIVFPEADSIPEPQDMYMHHFHPVAELPLSNLKQGGENVFSLQVDEAPRWQQNLIYGVLVRVYYEKDDRLKDFTLTARATEDDHVMLGLNGSAKSVLSVDYLAKYYGPDFNGNGIYNDWNHSLHRGQLVNHPGSSSKKPFNVSWDTRWIPSQNKEIMLSARIHFKDGIIGMPATINYIFSPRDYNVELCTPREVPQKWITRLGEGKQAFFVNGEPSLIDEVQLVFNSWSPGYLNGIYINDFIVFTREGPRYEHMQHHILIRETDIFQQGENILKTGLTPRFDNKMVHGTEIMWPGIMVLIKYKPNK
jgi:hypothetical protein